MQFAEDPLSESLHRLLMVLQDEASAHGVELPPLAVFDVRTGRWLLAAGISLEDLRLVNASDQGAGDYLIIAGTTRTSVASRDRSDLLAAFSRCARTAMTRPALS
jgi:hypothetical protein